MTTLSEQDVKKEAWLNYHLNDSDMIIADRRGFSAGFDAGFNAGLTYNKARIEELVKAIKNYFEADGRENQQRALIILNKIYDEVRENVEV